MEEGPEVAITISRLVSSICVLFKHQLGGRAGFAGAVLLSVT